MSKKQTPALPQDMEKELHTYFSSAEPSPEFISRLERGLHSKLKEQEQRRMFGNSKRKLVWGFGLALAAVLLGLLVTSPTVVAAMKRLLGYIPGVGLVESETPIRILAEPVSLTREGVTITVNEAVLSSDKTIVVYTVENIPFDKLSHSEGVAACNMSAELRLPNGALLQMTAGQGEGWGGGYSNRFTYETVPAHVSEATLFVPCIQDVLPGVLPENWELPLRFVTAPPDFAVMPVIEITPSWEANPSAENPILLQKVVETDRGYILIGEFNSAVVSSNVQVMGMSEFPEILDADGRQVQYTLPSDIEHYTSGPGAFPWAVELNEKRYRWPLEIVFNSIQGELANLQTEFDFDTGANPQPGQVWQLNKDIQLAEHSLRLISVTFSGTGYTFKFQAMGDLVSASVDIIGYFPVGGGGGGSAHGDFETRLDYGVNPPVGLLKIRLSRPTIDIRGPWTLEWQPKDVSSSDLPAPTESPQACLTLESWKLASANPAPIPAGLTGKVVAYGRILEDGLDPSPENYGIYVANLDGSNKHIIGPGVWPSLSPDGTRAAYAWTEGLYIADLATGQNYLIPNTNGNDYSPRWSPDGTRLAFVRIDDFNLYIINPDGTGLQRVTSEIDYEQLVDWSPDGASLFYGVNTQQGMLLKKLDLGTGTITELFVINSKGTSFDISPDGRQIAFAEPAGIFSYSLYIANIDGSERKAVANLAHWPMVSPVWSPDGKWLLLGILNADLASPDAQSAILNLESCQVIPLPLNGEVSTWVP